MKLMGDNGVFVSFVASDATYDWITFSFSGEWCRGQFEYLSDLDNHNKLLRHINELANKKSRASWLSKGGDLEIQFVSTPGGQIRINLMGSPMHMSGQINLELDVFPSSS